MGRGVGTQTAEPREMQSVRHEVQREVGQVGYDHDHRLFRRLVRDFLHVLDFRSHHTCLGQWVMRREKCLNFGCKAETPRWKAGAALQRKLLFTVSLNTAEQVSSGTRMPDCVR